MMVPSLIVPVYIMRLYISTDLCPLEEGKANWENAFRDFYHNDILVPCLNKKQYINKLQETFNLTEKTCQDLPAEVLKGIFGTPDLSKVHPFTYQPDDFSLCWLVNEDKYSKTFYRINKLIGKKTREQYPWLNDINWSPCQSIAILYSARFDGFISNQNFMNNFLLWYRGTTLCMNNYSKINPLYLAITHAVHKEINNLFGPHSYIELLSNKPPHQSL